MKKLAAFDFDGTLLDSIGMFEKIVNSYSDEKGLPRPCFETYKKGYGNPREHDFKWGVSIEEQLLHCEAIFQLGDRLCAEDHPDYKPGLFHGAEEMLRRLKADGYTLAIVTSKPEAPLIKLLNFHNIGDLFSGIRMRDDIERRGEADKPAPDMLASIIKELGFTPEKTAMIGDTTMDMQMGKAVGAHTIAVTWGAHTKDLLAACDPHKIIDTDFIEVARAIERF